MNTSKEQQLQSLSIDRNVQSPERSIWPVILTSAFAFLLAASGTWWFMNGQINQAKAKAEAAIKKAEQAERLQGAARGSDGKAIVPRASGMIASGYVVARRQATVSAEITGLIRDVLIEEGSKVEKGQILAHLDDTRAKIALEQTIASYTSSKNTISSLLAQLEEAKIVLSRAQILADKKIGPKAAVTAAAASLKTLQARLAGARADLVASQTRIDSQRDLIERHIIRAPFAGVVIAKNAQVGELLSPSAAGGGFTRTGVATLVDMASLEIEVDVNEGQIGRVKADQPVEAILDAYSEWLIPSRVIAIIPTADRARATIKVRVAFEELDERILPDMAAKVTFIE